MERMKKMKEEGGDVCTPMANLGFPGGSIGKESACNAGDLASIPGLGRSPGGGQGHPLLYSWPGESPCTEAGRKQSMGSQRVGHD